MKISTRLSLICLVFCLGPYMASGQYHHHVLLHGRDYQNYENYLFDRVKNALSKAFISGQLKFYQDKDLKTPLSFDAVNHIAGACEHVRVRHKPNDTTTVDTVICTPFDCQVSCLFLLSGKRSAKKDIPEIFSIGLVAETGLKKDTFYVAKADADKIAGAEQKFFLDEFYSDNSRFSSHSPPVVMLDSEMMGKYAREKLDMFSYAIEKAVKSGQLHSYASDSLSNPETDHEHKRILDTLTGIVAVFYLSQNEEAIQFNKAGIGVLYYPYLNNAPLPEQPLFFNRMDELKQYLAHSSNDRLSDAFQFYTRVVLFKMGNDWFDENSWVREER